MRKFNLEEARKLSHDEIQAIVCAGLSEVAEQLADLTDSKSQEREFRSQSQTFLSFAGLFMRQSEAKRSWL